MGQSYYFYSQNIQKQTPCVFEKCAGFYLAYKATKYNQAVFFSTSATNLSI